MRHYSWKLTTTHFAGVMAASSAVAQTAANDDREHHEHLAAT